MRAPLALLCSAGLTVLTACSPQSVTSPAGAWLDEGGFGNPTMNNTLVMTGQRNAVVDLSRRFAAEVPSTVNFAFNSDVLDAEAQAALQEQANFIRQFSLARFRVYGHTDKVGSDGYNKALGLRRARAVVAYLIGQGISADRLEAVVSFGEQQPLIVTEGRERRNRRTVTEVSGFLKAREQTLDGKYALFNYDEYVRSAYEGHSPEVERDPEAASPKRGE